MQLEREVYSIKDGLEHRNVDQSRRDDVSRLLKALHTASSLPSSRLRSFRQRRYPTVRQVNKVENAVNAADAMDGEDEVKVEKVKHQGFLTLS